MTISIKINACLTVSLSKYEETYIRARHFQSTAKAKGLADKNLTFVLDRNGNPSAKFVMHDAIHQLFNLSTGNPDEKLVDMIGTHVLYSIEPNARVKASLMAERVKHLLTDCSEDEAYYVYAKLHQMKI